MVICQKTRFWVLVGLFVLSVFASAKNYSVAAENDRPVVDQAPQNGEFLDHRSNMVAALRLSDIATLVSMATPDVLLDFGGGQGRAEFERRLTALPNPESEIEGGEGYRAALEEALLFGGRFTDPNTFEAPSSWTEPLPDGTAAHDLYLVLGADVPVYESPDSSTKSLGTVSFELVHLHGTGAEGTDFMPIRSDDDRISGYVDVAHLKSPLDYRAIFQRGPDGWKLTTFVAGD